jgi:hypothetical protein
MRITTQPISNSLSPLAGAMKHHCPWKAGML